MAEIRLTRQPRLWPWALAVVAVVAAAWLTFAAVEDRAVPAAAPPAAANLPAAPDLEEPPLPVPDAQMPPPGVAAFLAFARTADRDRPEQFVTDGVVRLTTGLSDMVMARAADDAAVRRQLEELQATAARLADDAGRTASAGQLRNLFVDAADLLEELRQAHWAEGEEDVSAAIASMRRAGLALDAGRPWRAQAERIEDYFVRSAEVLRGMSAPLALASAQ